MKSVVAICMALAALALSAKEPTNTTLNLENGQYYERYVKDYKKAATYYSATLKDKKVDDATKAKATLGLAACAMHDGRTDEALMLINEALKGQPSELKALLENRLTVNSQGALIVKEESPKTKALRNRLQKIIVNKISLQDTRITTVFEFLKTQVRNIDPAGDPINFLVIMKNTERLGPMDAGKDAAPAPADADDDLFEDGELGDDDGFGDFPEVMKMSEPTLTMDFDNIPLGTAIRYICEQANFKYKIADDHILIVGPGLTLDELENRMFTLDPELLNKGKVEITAKGLHRFFETMKVEFPSTRDGDNASLSFDPGTNRMAVRNTASNLDLIEGVLARMAPVPPQVAITVELLEVNVPEKVREGIRPEDLANFITTLPKDKRTNLGGLVVSGDGQLLIGVIGTGTGRVSGRDLQTTHELKGSVRPSMDTKTVAVDMKWRFSATVAKQTDQTKVAPILAVAMDKKMTIHNGGQVAIPVTPANADVKTGALYLVIHPSVTPGRRTPPKH